MLMYFSVDSLFSYLAWGGTALYALRILMMLGGAVQEDSFEDASSHFSDDAFQFLSLNTLVGFLMMFGWGGLAASRQHFYSAPISLIVAFCSGALFVWVTRILFKNAKKLVSSGTRFDIQKTVGCQGRVYQSIRENKRGVIQVISDNFTRELDALSIDNREIESFQAVEVIKVIDSKTVMVKRIK